MKPITRQTTNNIIVQIQKNIPVRQIAKDLSVSIGTVSNVKASLQVSVPTLKHGRHQILSNYTKHYLRREILSGKINNAIQGQKLLKEDLNINVSAQTVRNELQNMGLKAVVKSKKPYLTDKNKKKCLDFARKYQNWSVEQWKRVMFSNEVRINLQGVGGREWVYKPKGSKQYSDRIIKKTKKFNGGGFIVWGCMTYFGLGDASKLEGTVDAEYYKEILESYVIQTRDWYKNE